MPDVRRIDADDAEREIRSSIEGSLDDIDDIAGLYSFLFPGKPVVVLNDTNDEKSEPFTNGHRGNTRLDDNPITVEHLQVYFDSEWEQRDGKGICVDNSDGSTGMRFKATTDAADFIHNEIERLKS